VSLFVYRRATILKSLNILTILIVCILIFCLNLFSADIGAIFLKEPVGARQIAMGEAFVSVADDITSLHYNPAGLVNLNSQELNTMYRRGLVDISHGFLGYGISNKESKNSFGISLFTLQGGDIEIWESEDVSRVVKVEQDYILTVGYGKQLLEQLALGLNLKVIQSTLIEEYSDVAIAVDLGLFYKLIENINIGISVQNIGTEIRYISEVTSLPFACRGGISYILGSLTLSGELLQYTDSLAIEKHLGVEYIFKDMIALRAGYGTEYEFSTVSFGVGFKVGNIDLDYAQSLPQNLESLHTVSLTIK
jgi:hypothetical protein